MNLEINVRHSQNILNLGGYNATRVKQLTVVDFRKLDSSIMWNVVVQDAIGQMPHKINILLTIHPVVMDRSPRL